MYVQPILDSNNIAMHGKWDKFKQKLFDKIPDATFKNPSEAIERVTDYISRPAPNRVIMGATAIVLQPTIDASNKKVDEKTRKLSVCRTIAKIVVGTLVGIAVRGSAYKLVEKMTVQNGTTKFSKALLPDVVLSYLKQKETRFETYRSALSMLTAIVAMLFTNFLIDAPLTAVLTNKLQSKVLGKDTQQATQEKGKEVTYA